MLPTAVAQSSSGGVTIGYVLPVLWMTLCFHIVALWRVMEHDKHNSRDSKQILLEDKDQQVLIVSYTVGKVCYMRFPCYC